MFSKFFILLFSFFYALSLSAYEPPKINLSQGEKPKIIMFTSENILVGKELSYKISWKTMNATHVQISYLGNVELSGSVTVTEAEYKKGAITLTATSTKNNFTDSKTINKSLQEERDAPTIVHKITEDNRDVMDDINPGFYNPSRYNNRRALRNRIRHDR